MVAPQLLPQVSVGPGLWAATLWWHSALALNWALHAEALQELNDQAVDFSLLQQLSAKLPQLPKFSSVPAHCRIGLGLPASSAPPEAGNPQLQTLKDTQHESNKPQQPPAR